MDLKTALKWMLFLFCTIFTLQLVLIVLIIDIFIFPENAYLRLITNEYILELMTVALAGALPVFVMMQSKTAQKPTLTRHVVHGLLTFGGVYGLLIYNRWIILSDLSWLSAFIGFIVVYTVAIVMYKKFLIKRREERRNEEERKELMKHMDDLLRQHTAMRKFKHDQSNIFSSMDIFVAEDDWGGMKNYYNTRIKSAFEVITADDFALESLNKIKVREIKGILIIKLAMAQNLGIDVSFEADEEISEFPVDSVALVRILGILLDNAIEELEYIGTGKLMVGCFKVEDSVNFVVQNTCREDMPPLKKLQERGFSTKGKGRGLGLDNLYDITKANPNVALMTTIKDGQFIQKLMLGS